jgi:hypothetical protein
MASQISLQSKIQELELSKDFLKLKVPCRILVAGKIGIIVKT